MTSVFDLGTVRDVVKLRLEADTRIVLKNHVFKTLVAAGSFFTEFNYATFSVINAIPSNEFEGQETVLKTSLEELYVFLRKFDSINAYLVKYRARIFRLPQIHEQKNVLKRVAEELQGLILENIKWCTHLYGLSFIRDNRRLKYLKFFNVQSLSKTLLDLVEGETLIVVLQQLERKMQQLLKQMDNFPFFGDMDVDIGVSQYVRTSVLKELIEIGEQMAYIVTDFTSTEAYLSSPFQGDYEAFARSHENVTVSEYLMETSFLHNGLYKPSAKKASKKQMNSNLLRVYQCMFATENTLQEMDSLLTWVIEVLGLETEELDVAEADEVRALLLAHADEMSDGMYGKVLELVFGDVLESPDLLNRVKGFPEVFSTHHEIYARAAALIKSADCTKILYTLFEQQFLMFNNVLGSVAEIFEKGQLQAFSMVKFVQNDFVVAEIHAVVKKLTKLGEVIQLNEGNVVKGRMQ